jgi:allantoin racemase
VLKRVVALSRTALERDDSDVIVLGCAGMADLCAAVSAELGVPVIDGVAAATVMVESLIRLKLSTSTRGEYAPPLPKPYTGLLADFGDQVHHLTLVTRNDAGVPVINPSEGA